jgi:hypothetical protein
MQFSSKWGVRFLGAAFVEGAIAWAVIAVLVALNLPGLYAPAPSRIVAGGGAGTWFVMGLLSYLLIGIPGLAISGLFYEYLETGRNATFQGVRNALAWTHLVLGGGFAAIASLVMMYYGFLAGIAAQSIQFGGWGWTNTQIHSDILGPVSLPIAIFMVLALVGYLAGGVAYFSGFLASRKRVV